MKIKTTIEFLKKKDIDRVVCSWAEKSGFHEVVNNNGDNLVDLNNISHCYCFNQDNQKIILTIQQIDGKVQIEAWIAKGIEQEEQAVKSINELLLKLGQKKYL